MCVCVCVCVCVCERSGYFKCLYKLVLTTVDTIRNNNLKKNTYSDQLSLVQNRAKNRGPTVRIPIYYKGNVLETPFRLRCLLRLLFNIILTYTE